MLLRPWVPHLVTDAVFFLSGNPFIIATRICRKTIRRSLMHLVCCRAPLQKNFPVAPLSSLRYSPFASCPCACNLPCLPRAPIAQPVEPHYTHCYHCCS